MRSLHIEVKKSRGSRRGVFALRSQVNVLLALFRFVHDNAAPVCYEEASQFRIGRAKLMSIVAGRDVKSPLPDAELLKAANSASRNAYAPYSHFYVGCAIRTKSGKIYCGCNVENESFPAGMCAERAAVAAAVVGEGPQVEITSIIVYARGSDEQQTACAPCGICRQVFVESAPNAAVGFFLAPGDYREIKVRDLLPYAFRGHLR